jgi:hypothetical protein
MAEANQEKTNLKLEVSYVELTLLFDLSISASKRSLFFFFVAISEKISSLNICQVYVCINF